MKGPDIALGEVVRLTADAEPRAENAQRRSFRTFFQTEWPNLRAYLRRFVSRDEAEDIAQEAFARVYANREEVGSESGMLYNTARNLMIDNRRRRAVASRVVVDSASIGGAEAVADRSASPEENVDLRDRLRRAAEMLERMPPKARECFLLQTLEGLSYAEISERTGLPLISVKKQLARAFAFCAKHAKRERLQTQRGRRGQ